MYVGRRVQVGPVKGVRGADVDGDRVRAGDGGEDRAGVAGCFSVVCVLRQTRPE